MKTLFMTLATSSLILLTACTSTKTVISEYDKDGKVTKVTETSESIVSTVVKSTKDKTVIIWEDNFSAYISASSGTTEDPTPHGKLFIGKTNKGVISIHKDHKDISGIAEVIQSTKTDSTVSKDQISTKTKVVTK